MRTLVFEYRLFGIFKLWRLGHFKDRPEARKSLRWFARLFITANPVIDDGAGHTNGKCT
jgi:hypothetical protein